MSVSVFCFHSDTLLSWYKLLPLVISLTAMYSFSRVSLSL